MNFRSETRENMKSKFTHAQALKSIVKLCDTDSNANKIQKVRIYTIIYSQQILLHTYCVPGNCSQHWATAVNKKIHTILS